MKCLKSIKVFRIVLLVAFVFGALVLSGCYTPYILMPTPIALASSEIDPYSRLPESARTTEFEVFYFTNRKASGPMDHRKYNNNFGDVVMLGQNDVRIGDDLTWEELCAISNTQERSKSVPLRLLGAHEFGALSSSIPDYLRGRVPIGDAVFAEAINAQLAAQEVKVVSVFVHGFLSDFVNPNVFSGQLWHFAGRRGVPMTYAWPTLQAPRGYFGTDKRAMQSVDGLVEMLEFLGRHTDAEQINLLSYSAGAHLLGNALAQLRQRHADLDEAQLHERFKIQNVMFMAGDMQTEQFVNDLDEFYDIPEKIVVMISKKDGVLVVSGLLNTSSRLGRGDETDLTDEHREILERRIDKIEIIDVSSIEHRFDVSQVMGHTYWFDHPWISTDSLLNFYYDLDPVDRGLEQVEGREHMWYFPLDYPERIKHVGETIRKKRRLEDP